MSIKRPFCGRTSRAAADDVLAVQEIRPAIVHRPKSANPVSGTGVVPEGFTGRVVYLTTDAMPSQRVVLCVSPVSATATLGGFLPDGLWTTTCRKQPVQSA